MNIPPFWEKATGKADAPDGTRLDLTAWGWSNLARSEARENATSRLRRMVARVTAGEPLGAKYPYGGANALREEIVEEIAGDGGQAPALITRNSYGSLVLNTPDAMFIDVDLPPQPTGGLLRRLFGGKSESDDAAQGLRLQEALTKASDATFRIYRTAAGFRILAISRTFEPGSAEAERIMTSVGADPAFVQLCRAQKSFRARLTPKPWRCDSEAPPNRYPRTPEEEKAFREWLSRYNRKSEAVSVCRFVTQAGSGRADPAVGPVLRLHDQMTRVGSDLPLA